MVPIALSAGTHVNKKHSALSPRHLVDSQERPLLVPHRASCNTVCIIAESRRLEDGCNDVMIRSPLPARDSASERLGKNPAMPQCACAEHGADRVTADW